MHLNIHFKTILIMLPTLIYHIKCQNYGDRIFTARKADKVFEKYLLAVKKLSSNFPNHQIELHLDIADDSQRRRRYNYINLRKPGRLTVRSDGNDNDTELAKPPPETELAKPPSDPPKVLNPDMQPVYMKDLKKAIEELEKKYNSKIELKDETPQKLDTDFSMKQILKLLEKGTLVNRNIQSPPEKNMSWLQIKIPK